MGLTRPDHTKQANNKTSTKKFNYASPAKTLTLLLLFSFLLLPLYPTRAVDALNDHLSSANLITDESGAVVQKLDYLPFGSERLNEKSANFETHFTFTDQESDDESGLLYYGARYYNPTVGRFTQADPVVVENVGRKEFAQALQNPQMLNGYSYVGNNPMKYEDEEGEFAGLVVAVGIAVLGGVFLQNIQPAQAPEAPACFSAQPKTFGELVVPQFDALPGYQKEAIRWSPLLLGGLKSVGKEGLEAGIKAINKPGYGIKFGQESISVMFQEGSPFANKTIFEVAKLISNGKMSVDQLPIEYIIRNGEKVTLNNRSLATLKLLEQQPTELINMTGIQKHENTLTNRLKDLGGKALDFINIRGLDKSLLK